MRYTTGRRRLYPESRLPRRRSESRYSLRRRFVDSLDESGMLSKTALTRSMKDARRMPTEAHKLVKSVLGSRWNSTRYEDGDWKMIEDAIPVRGYRCKEGDCTRYEFRDGSAILIGRLFLWDFGIHRTWLEDPDFVAEWGYDSNGLPASYHDSHERFAYPK